MTYCRPWMEVPTQCKCRCFCASSLCAQATDAWWQLRAKLIFGSSPWSPAWCSRASQAVQARCSPCQGKAASPIPEPAPLLLPLARIAGQNLPKWKDTQRLAHPAGTYEILVL